MSDVAIKTTPSKSTPAPRKTRTRRATTKAINYSKEQEFSDDDVFEDGHKNDDKFEKIPTSNATPSTGRKSRAGRPRKSLDPDVSSFIHVGDSTGYFNGFSKHRYVEKGYDPTSLPIRDKYLFEPEYELDGSAKIELIVGRRPKQDKKKKINEDNDANGEENYDDEAEYEDIPPKDQERKSGGSKMKSNIKGKKQRKEVEPNRQNKFVEYEYLVKLKGKSYLHLEWKLGSDLESMNKSAKTLYRRFLKKLESGTDENLEDPSFDPSFAIPQKIVAEKEQKVMVELSDKELIAWEKERERELMEEKSDSENGDVPIISEVAEEEKKDTSSKDEINKLDQEGKENNDDENEEDIDWDADDGVPKIDKLRAKLNKDGPYYPTFPGCDNPYRDGYITTPPKKPRASYLFFQCAHRSEYQRKHKGASQGEIMTILGDTWKSMSEEEQWPYLELAREEEALFAKERAMMEKAQRPNELWQPIRRCQMVHERLSKDSFSAIFLEPVNINDFPDYLDAIDQPMDLGTIKKKLENKKYQAPEIFARDMRKVWNNCKIYNVYGSAIWHVADYMSKQFERLYHAWVLGFRERYLRWIHPKARPWEQSCRESDGKCGTADEKMVLCDHCDAMYGMACLSPPLKKLPNGIWHCPDCRVKKEKHGVRMLSALYEQAARKRAELGEIPKKEVKRKVFLVKWAGLGYENASWETQENINDDKLITDYRKLNNMVPDEPKLENKDIENVLSKAKHISVNNAKGTSHIPDIRAQLYAQVRAFHFSRFGMSLPNPLAKGCGPRSSALVSSNQLPLNDVEQVSSNYHPAVVECVNDLVLNVIRNKSRHNLSVSEHLPPLLTGEYDAVIPITEKGLMMNVGEVHGTVSFLGYREFPDGRKGPAELAQLVRNVGDKIIAVDGITTVKKTFQEVIQLLRESGKNKFAFMRFVENKYGSFDTELTSTGRGGQFMYKTFRMKLERDRRLLLMKRKQKTDSSNQNSSDVEDEDSSVGTVDDSEEESDLEGSDEELLADGDDYELIHKERMRQMDSPTKISNTHNKDENDPAGKEDETLPDEVLSGNEAENSRTPNIKSTQVLSMVNQEDKMSQTASASNEGKEDVAIPDKPVSEEVIPNNEVKSDACVVNTIVKEQNENTTVTSSSSVKAKVNEASLASSGELPQSKEISHPDLADRKKKLMKKSQETTRSLGLRLLDVDLGYSSDEGGYQDSAFFVDGVDMSFCTKKMAHATSSDKTAVEDNVNEDGDLDDEKHVGDLEIVPVKKNEFSALGECSKLYVATSLTIKEPFYEDFDKFPLLSKSAAESEEKEKEVACSTPVNGNEENNTEEKPKSKTKIEQLSTLNNDIIHIWASAEDACATLQISLKEMKQILNGDYNEDLGEEVGGFRWRYADEDAEVTKVASRGRDSKKGKQAYLEFKDKLYDHRRPHVYKGGHKLRDYQVDGVNWMASCWYKRHSCILADEMGLGKTVQIVTYIEHLHRVEKIARPFLVVVPLSTVEHWRREFEGWTDMECCIYHDRQREWRDVMREYEWYFADRPHTPEYLKFDVLVTTYDTLIGDYDIIGQIPWRVTVVDEAHRLRNTKGKLLECMKQISARGTLKYGFQSRILMTGTPLQNNTQELWTLLNFIEPYKFPSLEDFESNYGNMANREQVESLQRKISPFMLRRVKEDVAKDIPAKEETVIDVELTSIQKQYYRAIFEHNHSFLSMGNTRAAAPKLMNIQMELRKCCNHPFLLDGVENKELEKYHQELFESGQIVDKTADEQQSMLNEHGYINTSGKMVLLSKLLPKLRQEGHKVLIFSQMVKMLDLISEFCDFKNFRHERLDGRVRGNERQKAIDRFETEDDSFLFLLSTRAGGVGINLTAADICIIFDSDWNPQNDVQAQARCHRIGQTKDVMIYRLITSRTFEQEMFDRASKKLGLEQAVLGTFGQDNDDGKPTSKEMEQLLKKGAYALLEDENDDTGKQFYEDDIDSILAKRTRTRVVEGAKTSAWLNKSGMNVSKSKFTGESAAATANVDVDDPLFWQKVMPDFVTPTIMMTKLKDMIKLSEKPNAVEGPGRGRKRKPAPNKSIKTNDAGCNLDHDLGEQTTSKNPTRTLQKKVNQFMSDLTSMLESLFEDAEDDNLPQSEKTICQNLLLTISVKNNIFSEEQRTLARIMLKRLEGDRRRRCRTAGDEPGRFSKKRREKIENSGVRNNASRTIPEELMIQSDHKRRKRREKENVKEKNDRAAKKRRRTTSGKNDYVGEDGYLHHSDSEADWSDVDEDLYKSKKKPGISRKEARRRRAWASDKDPAKAAGRLWPVFPRDVVNKVLETMLEEVIKNDVVKGGLFSIPVPRDVFPEYYKVVKNPMDYGTMRDKLRAGEYRSAQALQKDFILVMQNCVEFNSPDSEIVKEARRQALGFPTMLKNAALEHNLFLSEDGTILEVRSDDEEEYAGGDKGGKGKKDDKSRRRRDRRSSKNKRSISKSSRNKDSIPRKDLENSSKGKSGMKERGTWKGTSFQSNPPKFKKNRKNKYSDDESNDSSESDKNDEEVDSDTNAEENALSQVKKPRIRISLTQKVSGDSDGKEKSDRRTSKANRTRTRFSLETEKPKSCPANQDTDSDSQSSLLKRKRRRSSALENSENVLYDGDKIPKKKKKNHAFVKHVAGEDVCEIKDSDMDENTPTSLDKNNEDVNEEESTEDPANVHMDIANIKSEMESLDGSIPSVRDFITSRGRWTLPRTAGDKEYQYVAEQILNTISRLDAYNIFADKVTDEEAPGYSDVIKKPMDFGTMKYNLENGIYGENAELLANLFDDFLLILDNCGLYNDAGSEVAIEAARVMGHLPETFANACNAILEKQRPKRKKRKKYT